MKKYIFRTPLLAILLALSGCSIEPVYYSEITPETFYDTQHNVWQRFYRPFTHWKYGVAGSNKPIWNLQELGTDEMCLPTRGSDWYNSGIYQQLHHHKVTYTWANLYDAWDNVGLGVALTMDTMEDLEQNVDFHALGFPEGTKESMAMQLQALSANFYKNGLDFFGGIPIYNSTQESVRPRSTDRETFEHIEKLLKEAIPHLPKKTKLGGIEDGSIHQAAGAMLLAQLYFNAESYIRENRYSECADLCAGIINGEYGLYELADDWTDIFGFSNESCPEIIWTMPSEYAVAQTDGGFYATMHHYNFKAYLGGLNQSGNNGNCLPPSLKPDGTPYEYKLGGAYAKFEDTDVRKQLYVYEGKGKYRGMFVVGELVNPLTGDVCKGNREYKNQVITMLDQVAPFAKLGIDYPTVQDLPSTIAHAEENSGVRIMKRSPMPNNSDMSYSYKPDIPVMRLTEAYYMLAECKMRAGDKQEAAVLINKVRARYFKDGNVDPNPVTAVNLDKYRMLDEWLIEFIGEARRRTDLIRWNAYVTEDWWDHKASNNTYLNRYPIPEKAFSANNLLEQNPGYK